MEPINQKTQFTRDQPVWWTHASGIAEKALFVAYRNKRVVIDVLEPGDIKRRKVVELSTIEPRDGEGGQP